MPSGDHPWLFSPFSCRLYIALLLMIGLFSTCSMRSSLGMAMVCMVNASAYVANDNFSQFASRNVEEENICARKIDPASFEAAGYQGSILWNPNQQSVLFSAPFFAGILTIVPSGYIADRFGPKWTLSLAVILYVLITLITPTLATTSYVAFLAGRFSLGLGEGFVMPSIAALVCRWFPITERSTVTAIYTSGNQFANIFGTLLAAQLCVSSFLGGWPAIFYCLGACGLIWLVVWLLFASNTPIEHKFIREKERNFLAKKSSFIPSNTKKHVVPWREMLSSSAVLANFFAMFAAFFGGNILTTYAPTYFRDVLRLDLKTNGVFTAIPFVAQLGVKNILGPLSDVLKKKKIVTSTTAVKIFQAIAAFGCALALLGLAVLVDCTTPALALSLIILMSCSNAANIPGVLTSLLCIAPPHTGVLQAMAQASGTIAAGLSPLFVGAINRHGTLSEWRIIFLSTAALFVLSGVIYLIFGSGGIKFSKETI